MRLLFNPPAREVTMRYVREVLRRKPQEIQPFQAPKGIVVWISKYSLLKQRISRG